MPPKTDHRRSEVKAQSDELGSSREQLLDAATRVFAQRGYQGASMNEIAAEAGFSKGALYWNFESKEDLFFALLDERVDRPLRALFKEGIAPPGEDASDFFSVLLATNRELALLFHEYSAMAVRDPKLGAKFVERNRKLRTEIAAAIEARNKALGIPLTIPAEQIATAVIGLAHGLSVDQLTDPESVPSDLIGQILSMIEAGNAAKAEEGK
ncbi:MAG TPA: TetR/AcrR family transcriptional regulator [Solirubrobacterales bacterium]|nr:TetR/AcrR family transcriptional regulator [Solirubrobacterales bacterium]